MASSETSKNTKTASASSTNDDSLKLTVAISPLRSRLLQKQPPPAPPPPPPPNNLPSESDALRWIFVYLYSLLERKQELRLREDLKEAEDASQCDLFPQTGLCKCFVFNNLGKLRPKQAGDGSDRIFNYALRRRFLRQVPSKMKKKK